MTNNSLFLDTKLNFFSNDYLSKCDLLNKYNLKSTHEIPKLKKIVLDFNLADLIGASENKDKEQTDSNVQIKASSIFYVLTGLVAYINFNKSLSSIKKLKISENNYSIKISTTNFNEINHFLLSFFVENWTKLLIEDFVLQRKKKEPLKIDSEKNIVLSALVPAEVFFELEVFLNKVVTGINSKNFNIKINFLFDNPNELKNSQTLIKNLPYFWISG
jgi:hypothetical protein